jgi:predicted metalloprotease
VNVVENFVLESDDYLFGVLQIQAGGALSY